MRKFLLPAIALATTVNLASLAGGAAVLVAVAVPAVAAAATKPVYTGTFSNVAVSGYDPVAYFNAHEPTKGVDAFKTTYEGAEYHFANAANLAAFKAEPAKYAPQYGGYCAWAVSKGYTASGDPKVWKVVNNKLYLNYNADVGKKWSQDVPGNIKLADGNWPVILKK